MRSRPSALPTHVIESLRVLFDILDSARTGLIPIEQIRWENLPKSNLPSTFLESLRRVTPPNNLVSFERFCAAFRLALFDQKTVGRLQRVRSEGKLNELYAKPTMGINGFEQKRSKFLQPSQTHVYASALRMNASQPSLNEAPILRLPQPFQRPASENYAVIMRKTPSDTSTASKTKRPAPLPPSNNNNFRPLSLSSSSGSSGMGDIRWQSNSPPETMRHYAEELQPQVVKHERLLEEETAVVERGMEITRQLLRWYEDRMDSLQKRRRMLSNGMVALDSSVHEQKLNFHRAQITELNRRMSTLMNSTRRGFPSHENWAPRSELKAKTETIRSAVRPSETLRMDLIDRLEREKRLQDAQKIRFVHDTLL